MSETEEGTILESSQSSNEASEEEPTDLIKLFIREAIDTVRNEFPDEIADIKHVRKELVNVLLEKFDIRNRWDESKDLTRIEEIVSQFQVKEDIEDLLPALTHAVSKRKAIIDETIKEVLAEMKSEDEASEEESDLL